MSCPSCHTLSCYVCRQIITGYEHFSRPPPYTGNPDRTKCELWDKIEQRGHDEVGKAAKAALEKYKADHPGAQDGDIDIVSLLPKAPARGSPSRAGAAGVGGVAAAIPHAPMMPDPVLRLGQFPGVRAGHRPVAGLGAELHVHRARAMLPGRRERERLQEVAAQVSIIENLEAEAYFFSFLRK